MTNALVQNIAKAKGFDPQEQLILQIALGGILGGNNGGALGMGARPSYNKQSNPWMGMITTLAGLLLAQKGTPTIGQSAMSLAKMLISSPSQGQPNPTQTPIQKIAPLQQAQASLTNPTAQTLQNSSNTLATFKPKTIQPTIPHHNPTIP
jgi:hypothetical protein